MQSFTPSMNLALKLSALSAQLTKRVDSPLSIHGISFTEYSVMLHLSNAKDQTMRRVDLANKIGLSASGVTRLLSPMEKIGLVEKQKNQRDARVSLVKLTQSGAGILEDASVTFAESSEAVFKALNAAEITQLSQLIDPLIVKTI